MSHLLYSSQISLKDVTMAARTPLFHHLQGLGGRLTQEDIVETFLPGSYQYQIISCKIVETSSPAVNSVNFDLEIRANVHSIEAVKKFLSCLNSSSSCTFNILSGRQDKKSSGEGKRTQALLRGFRKCCLNLHSTEDSIIWYKSNLMKLHILRF